MTIDTALFHDVCIKILYGCLGLITFILLERIFFFGFLTVKARRISRTIRDWRRAGASALPTVEGTDILSHAVAEYVAVQKQPGVSRSRIEDLSAELYINVNDRVGARLWLLDTIITAAPLLGLLGTILGIMDTFNALSSGGISDPAAVSRGIAAALLATAVGILTALYGLVGHNIIHRQADVLTERFKSFLLSATRPDPFDRAPAE